MEDLSADNWMLTCKIIFAEFGLPKKIMSDSGGNFISYKFRMFYNACMKIVLHCLTFQASQNIETILHYAIKRCLTLSDIIAF